MSSPSHRVRPLPPVGSSDWHATEIPEDAATYLTEAALASGRLSTPHLRRIMTQTRVYDPVHRSRLLDAQRPDRPTGLTALGLKSCQLGDEGTVALRPLLMRGGRLRTLDLRVN